MTRESDYMTTYFTNPLPNDGYPRMTMECYEILKEGVREGRFDRWCDSIGNHSRSLGFDMSRNIHITADPKTNHFQCTIWFGTASPMIEYTPIAPTIEFDTIDTRRGMASDSGVAELPPEGYFVLRNSKDRWFTTGIYILLDDYGMNAKKRVFYKCSTRASDLEGDEEYEDISIEDLQPKTEPKKLTTLEAWL